jgi:uncharacterized protein YigE (DUF2233 family)
LTSTTLSAITPAAWREITPGLEYAKINYYLGFPAGSLHVFRFNLKQYQLKIAFTQAVNNPSFSIPQLMSTNKAIIGINGGFFSPDLKPLGLRINEGQVKYPLKATGWWGVFYTKGQKAYIVSPKDFTLDKSINFAVQGGPRLVIDGKIPNLKTGVANRTALGITENGDIILAVTDGLLLSTQELADIMSRKSDEGGFDCRNALNLDGGSSTQLYVLADDFNLRVPGINQVTDAVLVVPKNSDNSSTSTSSLTP